MLAHKFAIFLICGSEIGLGQGGGVPEAHEGEPLPTKSIQRGWETRGAGLGGGERDESLNGLVERKRDET
jgi:hypothetical protein